MSKRLTFAVAAVVLSLSLVLAACAPAPTPTEAPPAPTEAMPEPTEAPPTEAPTAEAPTPTPPPPPVCDLMADAPAAPAAGELGSPENPIVITFVPSGDTGKITKAGTAIADCLAGLTGLAFKMEVARASPPPSKHWALRRPR